MVPPSTNSLTENVTVICDKTNPCSVEEVIETVNDFEDDIAVKDAITYNSQTEICIADSRIPVLKPGSTSNKRYLTDPRLAKTVLVNSN